MIEDTLVASLEMLCVIRLEQGTPSQARRQAKDAYIGALFF